MGLKRKEVVAHVVAGPCRRPNNARVFIDCFVELSNDKWDRLDSFHLLLSTHVLSLQVLLLVLQQEQDQRKRLGKGLEHTHLHTLM